MTAEKQFRCVKAGLGEGRIVGPQGFGFDVPDKRLGDAIAAFLCEDWPLARKLCKKLGICGGEVIEIVSWREHRRRLPNHD